MQLALHVCLICMPYMYALYVCLICMPYMYALYLCSRAIIGGIQLANYRMCSLTIECVLLSRAIIGGMQLGDLNKAEVEVLYCLDFHLHVTRYACLGVGVWGLGFKEVLYCLDFHLHDTQYVCLGFRV